MMCKSIILGLVFSIYYPLYAHWSVIENIHPGNIEYGKTMVVDKFGHKHVVYRTKITTPKADSVVWMYQLKDSSMTYNHWETPETLWSYNNQQREARDYTPAIAVDNVGNIYTVWSYTDATTGRGDVLFRRKVGGAWQSIKSISTNKLQPGKVAIAVNSDLSELFVAFLHGSVDFATLECYYSSDQGTSWSSAFSPITNVTGYPSVCYDATGLRYIIYASGADLHCRIVNADSIIGAVWSWAQCSSDPINGNVHLAYIQSGEAPRNLVYKFHPNGNTDPKIWDSTTVVYKTNEAPISISVYNNVVGILNRGNYFEYRSAWDTIPLPQPVIYPGWCVSLDKNGWSHIVGHWEPTSDNIYYFTNYTISKIKIAPDSSFDITYPGIAVKYPLTIVNKGNIIDTIKLISAGTRPGWIADFSKDTIYSIAPEATAYDTLIITPPDTAKPCSTDSTKFIASGVDWAVTTTKDTGFTFTKVNIDVKLVKSVIQPPENSTVEPGDTITYQIICADTWNVKIDSVTILDIKDDELVRFDTVWYKAHSDSHKVSIRDTLIWKIWGLNPKRADTLCIWGLVKTFVCNDKVDSIVNFAYSTETGCIYADTSNRTVHNIIGTTALELTKPAQMPNDTLIPGDTISYVLKCANVGKMPALNIVIIDSLDTLDIEGVTSIYPAPSEVTTAFIKWDIPCILPQDTLLCTFRAVVNREYKCIRIDTLSNYAVAFGDTSIIPHTAYSETTSNNILRIVKLNVEKKANPPNGSWVQGGDSINYNILSYNAPIANCIARNIDLTDTLDAIIDTAINISAGGVISNKVITWHIDSLAPKDTFYASYTGVVSDTFVKDSILNWCWLSYRCEDISSDTIIHHYLLLISATLEKEMKYRDMIWPDFSIVLPNDTVEYIITCNNTGKGVLRNVIIKDTVDTGVIVKVIPESEGEYDSISGVITWEIGNILPDSSKAVAWLGVIKSFGKQENILDTLMNSAFMYSDNFTGPALSNTTIHLVAERRIQILVEPDTSGITTPNSDKDYTIRVINLGNDFDVVDIQVNKIEDGWSYNLTYTDGSSLIDTDNDTKIDVGPIPPNDTTELKLKVMSPTDFMTGINKSIDTLVIWGISSLDTIVRDSACIITEAILPEISAKSIHNYPNPFEKDKGTKFVLALPTETNPTLIIYKRTGEVIKTLLDGTKTLTRGLHEVQWDATNDSGKKISAGTYIYILKADGKMITKKLVVLPPRRH
ncbi:MAG: FlgD immunoglobulin-like domain containing protein [bacterium]|nr:FlgD immunoglobulin-like domain containing protein [bacterium]